MSERIPRRPYLSELIESALIVAIALALVIVMIATSRPTIRNAPREALSRLIASVRSHRLLREFCK